uniref:Retrotransposon protein, putative, unclassified n=1 Tax=Oryza sativa subsp. japonica TaxID=39947 RepID=Q10LP8_ORYSJ|nr:retrotransposon protein, putative, unclassified [Oryza sativa Japonica Group]
MAALREWSINVFGSVTQELKEIKAKVEELSIADPLLHNAEIRMLYARMDELLYREEIMWLQRSRVAWLKEGDRNTKFFHRQAAWRSKKNKITRLKAEDSRFVENKEEMEHMAREFFQTLYLKDNSVDPRELIDALTPRVDDGMNAGLCKPFSYDEIADALFQIGPLKAPGPDGFPARFFQRNWAVLKKEVTTAVRNFFLQGVMLAGVNDTSIVLIPKVSKPEQLKEFRPISLCNVIYKVVSKCMVNRLRPILKDIISVTQSAFIPERLITDNALIAFECIHHIQKETSAGKQFCAYKLDLAKAYDRVDWDFLRGALTKVGFCSTWVEWVMACVTTVKYSVSFNGNLLEPFSPSRGLRQGDPLSPYLFLFVADGLSTILSQDVQAGRLEELKVCRRAPGVSHLLFADDSLLFFRACPQQASVVRQALALYQRCTGQLLSSSKCSLLASAHCPTDVLEDIKIVLQVETSTFESKYLGLPTPEGRMSAERFKAIKERLVKRLNSWVEKFMSLGAKDTLIKSVAQAIPTYVLGLFRLPVSTCEAYTKLIRDFWWGDEENKRKIHWTAWDIITRPKGLGGLGFRDLKLFNQALLGKQAWRLIQFPGSLCARILKAKYFPNCELVDAVFPGDTSPTWKGIEYGLELLKKGLVWRICDGNKVKIWRDQWVQRESSFNLIGKKNRCRLRWVSQLIRQEDKSWNEDLIRHVCHPIDAAEILKIKLPQFPAEDFLAWHFGKSGVYTVRSGYRLAMKAQLGNDASSSSNSLNGERCIWRDFWKIPAPPKVKIFAWRLATNGLATQENRRKSKLVIDDTCRISGSEQENAFHAVVSCPKSVALRQEIGQTWNTPDDTLLRYDGPDWLLLLLLDKLSGEDRVKFLLVLWRSWHLRNDSLFGQGKASVRSSVLFLQSFWETLSQIKVGGAVDVKGKSPVGVHNKLICSIERYGF